MTRAKCMIMLRNRESLILFRQERSNWIIAGSENRVHGELLASLPPVVAVPVKSLLKWGVHSLFALANKKRACNLSNGK